MRVRWPMEGLTMKLCKICGKGKGHGVHNLFAPDFLPLVTGALFISLVEIEVVEQANFFFETGDFPCNQFDFTLNCLRKRGFEYTTQ